MGAGGVGRTVHPFTAHNTHTHTFPPSIHAHTHTHIHTLTPPLYTQRTHSLPHSLSSFLSLSRLPSLSLSLTTQTVVNHVFLWGSVVVMFAFNYIYTAIDTRQRQDTLWVMQMASTRAEFWLTLFITPVIALFPRLVYNVFCLFIKCWMKQSFFLLSIGCWHASLNRRSSRQRC